MPIKIVIAEEQRKILLINNPPSFDRREKLFLFSIFSYLTAYKRRAPADIINKNVNIKTPLAGSDANACTEVKSPDLTIKVPSKVRVKDNIHSKIVHVFKLLLFSVTLIECISAVVNNQGNKDIFSTGSQNHQPPQPSS